MSYESDDAHSLLREPTLGQFSRGYVECGSLLPLSPSGNTQGRLAGQREQAAPLQVFPCPALHILVGK